MEYPIMIEIAGYVTATSGVSGFTIKITNDNIENEKGNHPEVSKEKRIFIAGALYPNDYHERFEIAKDNEYPMQKIGECRARSKELKIGDRVKCCVFMVNTHSDNGEKVYTINTNPNDIESYTKFELWLYPDPQSFYRLEVDSKESLKFRKQWFYTCVNREKYKRITGYTLYGYRDKKWVNKNPKITFPILWWIRVKTKISNLWKKIIGQENLLKNTLAIIGIIVGVISIVATIIFGIIGIVATIIFGVISIIF